MDVQVLYFDQGGMHHSGQLHPKNTEHRYTLMLATKQCASKEKWKGAGYEKLKNSGSTTPQMDQPPTEICLSSSEIPNDYHHLPVLFSI